MKVILIILVSILSTCMYSQRVLIDQVCYNSVGDDFGVRVVDGRIYFVSNVGDSVSRLRKDRSTGQWFTDVYEVNNCQRIEPRLLKNSLSEVVTINSDWYDGPLSESFNDSLVFFSNTSEGLQNGKMGIYYSRRLIDRSYTDPVPVPFNSDRYSCLHPYFDNENSELYFSSDKDGTDGNFDLYKVKLSEDTFGEIMPISKVNSDSNELFPFVYDSQLYFTSNRIGGHGGLDLYSLNLDDNVVSNLDSPFNSAYDDLSIAFDEDARGYFSSNRVLGRDDDIFQFYIAKVSDNLVVDNELEKLLDDLNGLLSSNEISSSESIILISAIEKIKTQAALIEKINQQRFDNKNKLMNSIDTMSLLSFEEKVDLYKNLIETEVIDLQAMGSSQLPADISDRALALAAIDNFKDSITQSEVNAVNQYVRPFLNDNDTTLSGTFNDIVDHYNISEDTLSRLLAIQYPLILNFDFDKNTLNTLEKESFDRFIISMSGFRGKIRIDGHTDSTGPKVYNQILSLKRAKTIKKLLISNGYNPDDISIFGHGEGDPMTSNSTREGRKKNRRVVLSVL